MTETKQTIPAGYREDDKGRLVREENIKPLDILRDELVTSIINQAKEVRSQIAGFRKKAESDIETFIRIAAEQYGVDLKRFKKGNLTLKSFDGSKKVMLDAGSRLAFDEKIHIAKELIDECLVEWTTGANDNLKTLVDQAFSLDQSGKMDIRGILNLSKLNIEDEKWKKAAELIRESVTTETTRNYIRCYEREKEGEEPSLIALDLATV